MTNGDEPINPDAASNIRTKTLEFGLTKREYFAAMALSGMQSDNPSLGVKAEYLARYSVEMADALIEALNK